MGMALIVAGIAIGKEWTEINYQRKLIDAEREVRFWREKAGHLNKKPEGPPRITWR